MKRSILLFAKINIAALLLSGCSRAPERAVKPLFQPSPDKDVTTSPEYHFSSFAGTVWKTKTKTAIVNDKRYTGIPVVYLVPPEYFDPTHPNYIGGPDTNTVAVLSPGIRLRITRLMHDEGAGGGLLVEAVLLDGPDAQKTLILNGMFMEGNAWSRGPTSNTNWTGDPVLLEKAEAP